MSLLKASRVEIAALLLRVGLGVVFLAHGLTKILVFTLPGTAQFFESVGFAGWLAYPVTLAEVAGGALLVLGIYSGPAALVLAPVMFGATSVHWPNGWVFTSANGGWEFPAFLTLVVLVYGALGTDGALSAWELLRRNRPARALEPQGS